MTVQRPPTIDQPTWTIAQQVCTPAELEVLELDGRGLSQWTIAIHLGISRRSVRERLKNAARKISDAQHKETA